MDRNDKLEAMARAMCGKPPTLLEQCEALKAENSRLFQELKDQYIKNYFLEYQLAPKKRGRKPNPKSDANKVQGIIGRPPKYSDYFKEHLVELVDLLRKKEGYKTDKEALTALAINRRVMMQDGERRKPLGMM